MGINLGEVEQLVHVTPMLSREYVVNSQGGAKMFLMKKWSATEVVCAPHAIVRNLGVQYEELDPYKTVEQVYANGSIIFMMNEMYYGSQGVVVEPLLSNGRLKSKSSIVSIRLSETINFALFAVFASSTARASPARL